MEEIGSRPCPGDSDPVWDPDDLSSVGELVFSTSGPSITRGGILAGLVLLSSSSSEVVSLVGWWMDGFSGLLRAGTMSFFLPLDGLVAVLIR